MLHQKKSDSMFLQSFALSSFYDPLPLMLRLALDKLNFEGSIFICEMHINSTRHQMT